MSKRYQAAILTASYNGLLVPNAPTIGTATAGGLSASVTFTAPSNVGGGAITSYTVISSPGGITGMGASSPVTVSGLTSGVSYTFTVVANNVYGGGPASAASNSITAVNPDAFIENLFSTYLYTGTASVQTITNGIDLAGSGGMFLIKGRNGDYSTFGTRAVDTARGSAELTTNTTNASSSQPGAYTFNSNGFTLPGSGYNGVNGTNTNYVSWTFREQDKFFDVVTYTGDGTSPRAISHNLGSAPGCVIIKQTNAVNDWCVWHTATGNDKSAALNLTDAFFTFAQRIKSVTSTTFSVGNSSTVNDSGATYVAYLFAHDAGGFGTSGSENVISCGSYTGNGSATGPTVTLGYEPQWVMTKRATDGTSNWIIFDNMRGLSMTDAARLLPNGGNAESSSTFIAPTSTGFNVTSTDQDINISGSTYIYIAIRRGPMAVPTSGTSVYNAVARTGTSTTATITAGFPYDWLIAGIRNLAYGSKNWDRLRGITNPLLNTVSTAAEYTGSANSITAGTQNGLTVGADSDWTINYNAANYIDWFFRRNPSVFDIVCYTGTGVVGRTVTHNLTVAPELMIVKSRTDANSWYVYSTFTGVSYILALNLTDAIIGPTSSWNYTAPTASVFTVNASNSLNGSGITYVAYLFATCAGVSKVGNYTGTGALQTINCGFTTGARFILIKRTDSTGAWYVYDSTRGITSGNDPYYLLNSNDAEVTDTNYVDTDTTGFQVTAAAPAGLNAAGGTYIFLAIA